MLEGIKGLLFDYGGTLDTDGRHWAHVLWEAYQQAEIPVGYEQFREAYVYGERALAKAPIVQPEDTFRDVLRKKVGQQFERLRQQRVWCPAECEQQETLRVVVAYAYEYARCHTMKSCAVLQRLKEYYPMVLVSNFYGNVEAVLRDFGLGGYFDAVVESAVVGVRKPDPAIYQMGVERLGMQASEVLVVGDSYDKDMVPARQIGCRTIWLKGEGWTDECDDASCVDITIYNIEDLLAVLL